MHDDFKVSETQSSGAVCVLRVDGQLNARSTPMLVDKTKAIKEQGKNLVLNLGGVTFIASSGIGGLLAIVEDYQEASLKVHLAELSTAVQSVIKLLNLDQFLTIDADETEAMTALEA